MAQLATLLAKQVLKNALEIGVANMRDSGLHPPQRQRLGASITSAYEEFGARFSNASEIEQQNIVSPSVAAWIGLVRTTLSAPTLPEQVQAGLRVHRDGTNMRAAMSPWQSARCRLATSCWSYVTLFWDVSSDFLRFRQRANPLVVVEPLRGRSFSFFRNICCVLRRNRHSSGKSPIAHNVKLSKQTPSLSSTSAGDVGPGALMGVSRTCGSDAMPVLLRPCSLIAPRAALYLPPLHATRAA